MSTNMDSPSLVPPPTMEMEGTSESALGSMSVNEIAPQDLRPSPPQGHSEKDHLMGQQPYHQVLQHFGAGHHMSPIHLRHVSHQHVVSHHSPPYFFCSPSPHCSPPPSHSPS